MNVSIDSPVTRLRGVGPKMAEKLSQLGIEQVHDLLFHLPLRYQDRTRITPIGALQSGSDAVVEGEIRAADVTFGRRRSLVCRLQDGTGTLTLRFFHFSAAQKNSLAPGTQLRCYGEVRRGASGLELYHPEYRQLSESQTHPVEECLTPIYPSTAGVSQSVWRKLCTQALAVLSGSSLPELLPGRAGNGTGLVQALNYLHAPPPDAPQELIRQGRHPAQLRLVLEELVAHNLSLEKLRRQQRSLGAPDMRAGQNATADFIKTLAFRLTGAQERVIAEIAADLGSGLPMLRLVQGDVGSGKTVVAACAALQAIRSGYQVAIMAPTEILAEQHWQGFQQWFEPLGSPMAWLTGRLKGKARRQTLQQLAAGDAALAVGTHALFQEEVSFARLGLVIVDEQQRFGVHQRLSLSDKASGRHGRPHQLVMTATTIPRTLAMVAYADLDCSVIDELPPGRRPVQTVLIDSERRQQVVQRVQAACDQGRQAYWVCTLIEESDALQRQAAEATCEELQQLLPQLHIGLVHGRMKAVEKAAVMAQFKSGEIQVLVATTVIEVGVDVANASLMIIENPERLGLAQLHQLRGRIGRGSTASHCVLLYQSPLGEHSKARLTTMRESSDGFYIAERDLELRGPGEVLGTRQTGLMEFRLADIQLHGDLLPEVQRIAQHLVDSDPARVDQLIRRWLGSAERFASV
ncbi:MAG: ATP-dependent DNA helicase RecG [Gammaproteobacteria bacterium]|nr:ATP-dependent DNA helicase RecG [Gammaproteobacteria bacterium]